MKLSKPSLTTSAPQQLWMCNEGKTIFTIRLDGTVELGEGVSLDEAGRAFWKAVANMAPAGFKLTVPNQGEDQ